MKESTSTLNLCSYVLGVALITTMPSSSLNVNANALDNLSPRLVRGGVIDTHTSSRSKVLFGELRDWRHIRVMQVKALRGKYRNSLTPSDEFAGKKLHEIALED